MTVISKNNEGQTKREQFSSVYLINIGLILTVFVSIIVYSFVSNKIISDKYLSTSLKQKLEKASVDLELYGKSHYNQDDVKVLSEYAINHGMIEARDTASYYEDAGVAMIDIQK